MMLVRSVREKGTKMAAFRGKLVQYFGNGGGRVIYPPEETAFKGKFFFSGKQVWKVWKQTCGHCFGGRVPRAARGRGPQ